MWFEVFRATVCNEFFLDDQPCQYGVSIHCFRNHLHHQGLMWWVLQLCIYTKEYATSCPNAHCLRVQWVESDGQWCPVPAWTTGGIVRGVWKFVVTAHVAGHWAFLMTFFDDFLAYHVHDWVPCTTYKGIPYPCWIGKVQLISMASFTK
jgi:hypothetical protein